MKMGKEIGQVENTRHISFLAFECVFTLTQIGIYPMENHSTSNKVKLYLEDMSQKGIMKPSTQLIFAHFDSGHPLQTMDE